jgi:hypothetical protein
MQSDSDKDAELMVQSLRKRKDVSIGFCFRHDIHSEQLLKDLIQNHPQFSDLIIPLITPQISPVDPDEQEVALGDLDFVLKGSKVIVTIKPLEFFVDEFNEAKENYVTLKMTFQQFEEFCYLVKDFACFTIDDDAVNYG